MLKSENISIDRIYVPVKRRKTLKPAVVQEIAESILEIGQQTPIAVRHDGDRFILVEGLHRLEACKALGEESIQCVLVSAELAAHKHLWQRELSPGLMKMEHLKRLRLQKEAAERSAASSATPEMERGERQNPTRTRTKSRSAGRSSLAAWMKDQELRGSRY